MRPEFAGRRAMRLWRCGTFGAALLAVVCEGASAGVMVQFRERATAAGSLVTLADVADVRGTDAAEATRLQGVVLGPAPGTGRESAFEFQAVRSRLMASGVDLSAVEFAGPTTVRVQGPAAERTILARPTPTPPAVETASHTEPPPAAAPVPQRSVEQERQRVEASVESAIRRHLAVHAPRLGSTTVTLGLAAGDLATLATAATGGYEVGGGQPPYAGRQVFLLRFLDRAEKIREVAVPCEIAARPLVLAAAVPVPRGQVLTADQLTWRAAESDSDRLGANDPTLLIGREVVQSLRPNQVVTPGDVKAVSLVRSNQFVAVTCRRPGIAVQRQMRAKADGGLGDVIAVQTLEDHRTLLARVTGSQEAEAVETTPAVGQSPPPVVSGADVSYLVPLSSPVAGSDAGVVIPAGGVAPFRTLTSQAGPPPVAPPAASQAVIQVGARVLANPCTPLSVPELPVIETPGRGTRSP